MNDTMFPISIIKIDPSLPPGTIRVRGANGTELVMTGVNTEISYGDRVHAFPEDTAPPLRAEHPGALPSVEEGVAYACWRHFYLVVEGMNLAEERVQRERTCEALELMGVSFERSEEGRLRAQEEQQRQDFRKRERDGR
jgi:hypothetical protein